MSDSTSKSWWIRQPGEMMGSLDGSLSGLFGLLFGVSLLTAALALGLRAVVAEDWFGAASKALGAGMLGFVGLHVAAWGEASVAGWFRDSRRTSTARVSLGARAAVLVSVLVAVGCEVAHVYAGMGIGGGPDDVSGGVGVAVTAMVPALVVGALLSRQLLRLDGVRGRRVVIGWAGFTALSVVGALVAASYFWFACGSLATLSAAGPRVLWTLVGSAVALAMAASARKRLAIWDGADRWREATLTPDLRLVFADGSGSRPASAYFSGYSGPVVVMPTAAEAGAVFRGDGAPADGWVVPGTRAALEEAVRCSRVMARVTVAAVALVATAPLAVWLSFFVR